MKQTFQLTIEPLTTAQWRHVPGIIRLRTALKALLRSHGLRCVGAEEVGGCESYGAAIENQSVSNPPRPRNGKFLGATRTVS